MGNDYFWENYDKWKEVAWQEFVDGEFYNGETRDDIEITEDGTVYYASNLMFNIKRAVTPWKESEFYVP